MVEKDLQNMFSPWIQYPENKPKVSTTWELKLEKGTSIAFDRVAPHQVKSLYDAKHTFLYHKISDSPVSWMKNTPMRFGKPKPADCMMIVQGEGYVVLLFYKPREPKLLHFIDIDAWLEEKEKCGRKSITPERAAAIASFSKIIKLKAKEKITNEE